MPISDLRREYNLRGLRRKDLAADPIAQFSQWFDDARKSLTAIGRAADINAMTLATASATGHPSARTVLLKGVDERGFVFFTNYESRKGKELVTNPNAALTFFWPELERQVCVNGDVTRVSLAESEAYFKSRPRGSRLAAWASPQSQPVPDRAALEDRYREMESKYPGEDIPCPPFWGGYVLRPIRVEFWQGRANRLHDRFAYLRQAGTDWKLERLSP